MSTILFSAKTERTNDAHEFMPEFTAPKNYKDEHKIAAYKAEKEAEFEDICGQFPFMSDPTWIAVRDLETGAGREFKRINAAKEFAKEFNTRSDIDTIIGFDTKRMLRCVVMAAARQGKPVDPGLWLDATIVDLENVLLPVGISGGVDLAIALVRLGIDVPRSYYPGIDPMQDLMHLRAVIGNLDLVGYNWAERQLTRS